MDERTANTLSRIRLNVRLGQKNAHLTRTHTHTREHIVVFHRPTTGYQSQVNKLTVTKLSHNWKCVLLYAQMKFETTTVVCDTFRGMASEE